MSERVVGSHDPAVVPSPPGKDVFDATWLRAREPVDHRSRDETMVARLDAYWAGRQEVALVDLGCGTGSNARFLAPRLHSAQRCQRWVFVDHDEHLLARVEAPPAAQPNRRFHADLDDFLSGMPSVTGRCDCITASALLDLVSESWMRRLVDVCRGQSSAALFALTYDGQVEWVPSGGETSASSRVSTRDADDQFVRDLVNTHQHHDKGLGAALGPAAGLTAKRLFEEAGYHTKLIRTPWRLAAADTAVVEPLVNGWVAAATECAPAATRRIRRWASRRKADVYNGRVTLTVGHIDLLALPGDPV